MNRNPRVDKVLLAYTGRWLRGINPVVRWRILIAAFLLALVIGSSGQASIAQAAPAGQDYRFSLNIVAPRTIICIGETVTYKADVYGEKAPFTGSFVLKVAGVKIEAFPSDQSIGAFIGANKAGSVSGRMGSDLNAPTSIVFKFKAGNKPGNSKLFFDGAVKNFDIQTGYISFTVPIRVIPCKYTVTTTTQFPPNPNYNPMILNPRIKVKMNKAMVTADETGHFNGPGTLHWFGSSYTTVTPGVGAATAVEKFSATSQTNLNGELFENGQLVLNLTYETASSSFTVSVLGVSRSQSGLPYILDPLKISVPAAGGTVNLPQGYNQSSFMGKVHAVVTLVKGK